MSQRISFEPRFKPGDHVFVLDERGRRRAAGGREWLVVDEDTNRTPVRDHEPAYRLRKLFGTHNSDHVRYAYESCLILAGGDGDADQEEAQEAGARTAQGGSDEVS